jgi:hypothetical protein
MRSSAFDPAVLALWDKTAEIEIETSRGDRAPVHRTTIWIVVDGTSAYVRSVRGPAGRWYRELSANPHGAVHVGGLRVLVHASPATDADTVTAVSAALTKKYESRWAGPTAAMLRPDTLQTTLRLEPE